jgi:hypothetical protein
MPPQKMTITMMSIKQVMAPLGLVDPRLSILFGSLICFIAMAYCIDKVFHV